MMTPNRTAARRGITLTEILISILIMGVGVSALFTLFPLGVLNVRAAARYSRSAFLVESATADLGMRNLLAKASVVGNLANAPWFMPPMAARQYDPWLQDTPAAGADPFVAPFGAYRGDGPPASAGNTVGPIPGLGLPVAYDPLWRSTTGVYPTPTAATEARFGSGIGFVRADPQGGLPSAHGLQRITNFPSWSTANVPDIFVSPDDLVFPSATDASKAVGAVSAIVPDLGTTNPATGLATVVNDWKYTWMFTGQQAYSADGTVFVGDVVVFDSRPLAVDPVVAPIATTPAVTRAVAGETVVEAIFGATGKPTGPAAAAVGYGTNADRAVLLRWSDKLPDPEIRVGGWFADVTYERDATIDNTRTAIDGVQGGAVYPYQRCYWYQVAKRTQAGPSTLAGYRELTVWTSTPLRAFTLLNRSTDPAVNGTPYHLNAALICPAVVNVFPRTVQVR